MKKNGFDPFILLTGEGDEGGGTTIIGGGTGGGAQKPFPMSYDDWKTSGFQEGYDFNEPYGEFDEQDYRDWWSDCMEEDGERFTPDLFAELNSSYGWTWS